MFKIYIGNLENGVTLDQLKELTSSFTDIEDLVLVMDPETGESRCFAIAMFRDAARGQLLIETLSGNILNGRPMIVNEVVKKAKGAAAKKPFRRPQRGNGSAGGDRGRSSENRPVSRQMDFPSSDRPAEGGGMPGLGSMGGMSGPPRIPTRPPSGRPSSRPVSRGISRGNFGNSQSGGSAIGGSPGGSSGFARPNAAGNSPAGNRGPFRPASPAASPAASSPASPPQTPPAITPKPIPQPPAGNVSPTRSATPKPPAVRRLDTPSDQGNPSGA